MEILLFLYSSILLVAFTTGAIYSFFLYYQYREKLYLLTCALFALFSFDNLIIFMTENIDSFAMTYHTMFMSTAAFKTSFYLAVVYLLFAIMRSFLREEVMLADYAILIVYGIFLLVVPGIKDQSLMTWAFFLPTQLIIIYVGITGYLSIRKKPKRYRHPVYKRIQKIALVTAFFGLAILIEDSIVIFFYDSYAGGGINVQNRSFTENMMVFFFAVIFMHFTFKSFAHPGKNPFALQHEVAIEYEPFDCFDAFRHTHQLTNREEAVLRLLLENKDSKEIAVHMFIAVGTVKTHMHNIYQKVNVAKKSELINIYKTFEHTYEIKREN